MFKKLIDTMDLDSDYSKRSRMIDAYTRILNSTQYEHLSYSFFTEYDGSPVLMEQKRPAVIYNLCRIVMDEVVSLLFGEDHFPKINIADDENAKNTDIISTIIANADIREKMMDVALTATTGSAVVLISVMNQKLCIRPSSTQYFTPTFDFRDCETLVKLTEQYKITGRALNSVGYNVNPDLTYWFKREWDDQFERYFKPLDVSEATEKPFVEDKERTFQHGLGVVPAVWIKTPDKVGANPLYDYDGECLFSKAIDSNIVLDYQVSQACRALRYSSDPMVIFKLNGDAQLSSQLSSVNGTPALQKSSSKALVLGAEDDAKYLEITGKATETVRDIVFMLREYIIESLHGNKSNANKITYAQSGKSQREMNQPLIWLADRLRINFGEKGLLPLINLILLISNHTPFKIKNTIYKGLNPEMDISLSWQPWYPPSPDDQSKLANTLQTYTDAGIMSKETAIKYIQPDFNIDSVEDEQKRIQEDQKALQALKPKVSEVINA